MSTTELTDRSGSVPTKDGEARLAGLRSAMRECAHGLGTGVEAYIIPSEDAHMSEYAPECDNRRHFVSGFTGSAGTAVVTTAKAALWTDGRYFLQAEQELGEGWELMRSGVPGTPEISQFLAKEVSEGGFVGIDPFLHTTESARKLEVELKAAGRRLVPIYGGNLVDAVWAEARPPPPKAPLYVHPVELAGASAREKIESLQGEVSAAGAEALLLTMLDEVAWALNLRGGDVDYNPVFVSYALLRNGAMTLYVDREKVTGEVEEHLRDNGVVLKPYEDIVDDLQALAGGGSKIMVDPAKVSYAIVQQIEAAWQQAQAGKKRKAPDSAEGCDPSKPPIVEGASPVAMAKAMKNEKEAAGMREAHRRDGIVLAKCFHRIEKHIAAGGSLTEVEVDEWITALRREQPGFKQPSFPTIAGEGPNGAVIHYRAAPNSCRTVSKSSMLLVDSGGQYDCGTTDVTRTMHFGEPSQHQVATFTAVLKGHIALATAVFPPGTPGIAIDAMARRPLWSMGLNYRHGTGHGVGAALNVHEGPQTISTRYYNTTPLKENMIVSNEPGYYEDGAFGIRIENLMQIVEAKTPFQFGGERYLAFEPLTMAPIQRKLINVASLSEEERAWVDSYHGRVWDEISPHLGDDAEALEWLRAATQPLRA